jgi:serralysin
MKNLRYYLLVSLVAFVAFQSNAQIKKQEQKKIGCATIEPTGFFAFDTSNIRGLADNYYLWDNGKTLNVKFMGTGNSKFKDLVKKYAKEWEQYANLKFNFIETGDAHIRVLLTSGDGGGHYTRGLGIQLLNYPQDEFNLHLDTSDFKNPQAAYRTIIHEFGHAIGLMHEHMSPVSGVKWDKTAVYARYKLLQGWDKAMVDAQLFTKYNTSYVNGTKYDRASIMHYPISRWETLDGYYVDWNSSISEGDKSLVKALYPKGARTNEFPRFSVTNFSKMDVEPSKSRDGIAFYPSFTISTAGKEGKVVYLTVFFDETGNPVATNSKDFNFSGLAATNKSAILLPGQKIEVNRGKHDLELFIPYNELPESIRNKKISAKFFVFLLDKEEFKRLYVSDAVSFNTVK